MNGFHEDLEKQMGLIKERFGAHSKLVDELEASIELQKLWSSAFDHGTCTTKWVYEESKFPQPMPYDYEQWQARHVRMIITRGDGAEYSVPWRDIPDYFKRAEAKRRGITAETDRKSETLNNRENKVLHTWLRKERMRERRNEARYGKKPTKLWTVIAKRNVEASELSELDRDVPGNFAVRAASNDEAIDVFHSTIPIEFPEHFIIWAELEPEKS